mmetsp:Transcript_13439/g.44270  ORF Transcript_13439/g.44270 Transcript_13439/m.44270 type:complete len:305 (+) Transcript_13439:1682-2596(+)
MRHARPIACCSSAAFRHGSSRKTCEAEVRLMPTAPERTESRNTVVGGSFWKASIALARCFIGIEPVIVRCEKPRSTRRVLSHSIVELKLLKTSALYVSSSSRMRVSSVRRCSSLLSDTTAALPAGTTAALGSAFAVRSPALITLLHTVHLSFFALAPSSASGGHRHARQYQWSHDVLTGSSRISWHNEQIVPSPELGFASSAAAEAAAPVDVVAPALSFPGLTSWFAAALRVLLLAPPPPPPPPPDGPPTFCAWRSFSVSEPPEHTRRSGRSIDMIWKIFRLTSATPHARISWYSAFALVSRSW